MAKAWVNGREVIVILRGYNNLVSVKFVDNGMATWVKDTEIIVGIE